MKTRSLSARSLLAMSAGLLGFAFGAHAQTLFLDFGPTAASGEWLTNSPYHTANPGATASAWNTVGNTDTGTLVLADGSAATGVSLNIGSTRTAAGATLNLDTSPSSSSALGGQINSGNIYGGSSVGKDAIFDAAANATTWTATGFQLTGLEAGTYDIYVTARNTSGASSNAYTQTIYAGAGAEVGDFALSPLQQQTLSYATGHPYTSAWVEGENYVKLTVVLSAGEVLNLAVAGSSATEYSPERRGFLNSVQIVQTSAIPEPSTVALLVGGAAILFVAAMRFRRHRH
ncbi:glycosyltransferase family 1 [Opitutaceae bacterium TAV5]|nr:glycosyltransferase family 1 [Opitutaceae bacterium TAV5]